jgi:hypothetical protein
MKTPSRLMQYSNVERIRSTFQQLNRPLLPIDGTKPDLSVTIAKAVNPKAAAQAMISTLKAPRQKDKD